MRLLVGFLAACNSAAVVGDDAGITPAGPQVVITAHVTSTRFIVREHMLASAEMQISGEPLAEAMGRDLGAYSRIHVPPDLYFDPSPWAAGPWVDLAGFSTGVESYEYSKQPMNNLAFEAGAGTSLAYGPLVNPHDDRGAAATGHLADLVQHFAAGSHTLGRFVFPAGEFPTGTGASNPIGWPGMWPTAHVFASFDPAIAPSHKLDQSCSISSDDNPGQGGGVLSADYECDATSLRVADRAAQMEHVVTPGADGFSAWKYSLWSINYLQVMHDANEAGVASVDDADLASVGVPDNQVVGADDTGEATAAGTYLGSSDIEGFQAQLFLAMLDNRAEDWLMHFATDGAALVGFADLPTAVGYSYTQPLRWFPQLDVAETTDAGAFPRPTYTLHAAASSLLDLDGVALGYATAYALTDTANAGVGGGQTAQVYFDGDPFAADNQQADGEPTLHDRALAMIRVAVIDLDRMHTRDGIVVDERDGTTVSTTSLAYTLVALRTVLRATSSQLQLYSNNTPDTAVVATPLDALPLHYPGDANLTFSARTEELLRAQADLMLDHLTDASGRAFTGWNVATGAPVDQDDTLDAHTAAIRGLFTAFLATGDVRYRDRALAVYRRLDAVFYDVDARIYSATPAPVDDVEYTPLRFGLLQSTLRDMYELVATRPGGEALEPVLEERIGRLNKLVLNGWDDRDRDRMVGWPNECVNVIDDLPRGGLQMAERTLTGEIGIVQDHVFPGHPGDPTSDRENDCVPEVDDALLPAALAAAVTFHIARPQ